MLIHEGLFFEIVLENQMIKNIYIIMQEHLERNDPNKISEVAKIVLNLKSNFIKFNFELLSLSKNWIENYIGQSDQFF